MRRKDYTFRDPQEAFEDAVYTHCLLTIDPDSKWYAGAYMYMYTDKHGRDYFKHSVTRQYIHTP